MGNDGGVIAVKRKFMRHGNRKKADTLQDEKEKEREKISTCALSNEVLISPVVVDGMGKVMNKTSVLTCLLEKTIPESFQYIESLKDIRTINVPVIQSNGFFQCPITHMECNGTTLFILLSCGCLLSEKALKEIKQKECLSCNAIHDTKAMLYVGSMATDVMKKEMYDNLIARKGTEKSSCGKKKKVEKKKNASVHKMKKNVHEKMNADKEKSTVYASLFAKKKQEKSANDLLMTIGGLRYTLS